MISTLARLVVFQAPLTRDAYGGPIIRGKTVEEAMKWVGYATGWVQWFIANLLIDSQSMASRTWRQNQYLELRFNRCQNRLTKSIDQLTRVRCVPRKYLEDGRMQV